MKIERTFLHSKLARRIFWLFVLCALVPITALALISLRNVSEQLSEQSQRELRRTSRETGMSLYERLDFVDANLKMVATRVRESGPVGARESLQSADGPFTGLGKRFKGLTLLMPDSPPQMLFGRVLPPITYTDHQQETLNAGHVVLSTEPCEQVTTCVLLGQALKEGDLSQGILVGEVQPVYLWDAEDIQHPILICVLDAEAKPLFCSGSSPQRFPEEVRLRSSGDFSWARDERENLASFWNLPLQNYYGTPHWTIVSSEAKPDIMAPLQRFWISFSLVFLLAVWIVLLLSLVQIRRSLIPLAKLKEGTREVASGNFQTRVEIESGDEFQELAGSFNWMAERIEKQLETLEELQWGTLTALARAIDAKSPWTLGHSERVTDLAMKIARRMSLSDKELSLMRRGGLVHDVGKIGTPPDILDKPGRLTEEETRIMREHVNTGVRILQPIPSMAESLSIVAQHHEWVNGSGYPNGLRGEGITLHARIFAIADCFDALVSDRPYRKGLSVAKALQILEEGRGKQFDPAILAVFEQIILAEQEVTSVRDLKNIATAGMQETALAVKG
jgi:putative nucleotidyltransferase with HDIG domain